MKQSLRGLLATAFMALLITGCAMQPPSVVDRVPDQDAGRLLSQAEQQAPEQAARTRLEAANILAEKSDWPQLYDLEVLSRNTVPVACAIYADDMFVNAKFSRETVDAVPNMKAFYTSEYEHCGLRVGGEHLFSRLIDLGRGEVER